jgi:O-Antigen ligase
VDAERMQSPGAVRVIAADRFGVLAVGIAVVYATVAQGAFAADHAAVGYGLVGVAAAVALLTRRAVPRPVVVAVGLLVALAVWTAARAADGATQGSGLAAAVWAGLPILAVAAAALAVAGLQARARAVLTAAVVAAGLSVAATGWVGVAWHAEPLALVSSGLWRASSTLTYANASASFLVTALFVTAATAGRLGPRRARLVTAALLVGLLATMSRAGLFALVFGVLVAVAVSAARSVPSHPAAEPDAPVRPHVAWRVLVALWPALPGAAVATAGLLPGLTEQSAPHPLVAAFALAAGLGIAVLAPVRPTAVIAGWARFRPDLAAFRTKLVIMGVVAVAAVAVLAQPGTGSVVDALVATRLSGDSPERADLRRVTAEQFRSAPLVGVGPGRLDLVYVDYLGRLVVAEYTHDEFLQTAAETGLVGAGLAVAVFACLGAAAFRRRRTAGGPFAAAVLAAFVVHSTFDFLWHIPVLPLVVVAAVVPLLDEPSQHPAEQQREEEVTR